MADERRSELKEFLALSQGNSRRTNEASNDHGTKTHCTFNLRGVALTQPCWETFYAHNLSALSFASRIHVGYKCLLHAHIQPPLCPPPTTRAHEPHLVQRQNDSIGILPVGSSWPNKMPTYRCDMQTVGPAVGLHLASSEGCNTPHKHGASLHVCISLARQERDRTSRLSYVLHYAPDCTPIPSFVLLAACLPVSGCIWPWGCYLAWILCTRLLARQPYPCLHPSLLPALRLFHTRHDESNLISTSHHASHIFSRSIHIGGRTG